jgi:hypothetical protein
MPALLMPALMRDRVAYYASSSLRPSM